MKASQPLSNQTPLSHLESGHFTFMSGLFVATLLISNTVAAKPWQVGPFVFPGGAVLFPISYLFADVLTEVYGYARARQAIWTGFAANALMALTYWIAIRLPPAQFWENQIAFKQTLGHVPRVVLASFLAYLLGEFANSFLLAKMKIWTGGRHLWARTIGSTIVGQALDTATFVTISFAGDWPVKYLAVSATSLYAFKVFYEIAATPITYVVVRFLKEKDQSDYYDVETNFSPFRWRS